MFDTVLDLTPLLAQFIENAGTDHCIGQRNQVALQFAVSKGFGTVLNLIDETVGNGLVEASDAFVFLVE
jgi:hypothetical protein